ncbi:MAG TPA: hypothetical protein PLC54_06980 [Spirochaetales bacterium]|nr:hypothetical protein [Spirochaetales bacterium]
MKSTVENDKSKVLVVYEDGDGALESAAKEIKAALSRKAAVKVRAASEVSVPEVLASSTFAFGVSNHNDKSWAELKRIMTGINLAGRRAGFFVGSMGASAALQTSFAPAELSLVKEELSVSGDGLLKSWAAGLLTRV